MVGRFADFLVASTLLIFANSIVNAQEYGARTQGDPLIPTCRFEGALCGYVNPADETVIAPKYDWADRFSEGRAKVRFAGFFGFIDESGQVVVPLIYDNVSEYWHGFTQVRKDGRTALIDKDGSVIGPAGWDQVIPLGEDRYLVGRVPRPERQIGLRFRPPLWSSYALWFVVDERAGALSELPGTHVGFVTDDPGSMFWVKDFHNHYLFDTERTQITDGYDFVGDLRDGMIEVRTGGLTRAIDQVGNVVIPIKYDQLVTFTDDKWFIYHQVQRSVILPDRKSGYIDRDGNVMIEARLDTAAPFEGDVAAVSLDGKEMVINRAGESIGRADGCQDGLTKEMRGERFVILGLDGRTINDETYHYVNLICGAPADVMLDDDHMGLVRVDGGLVGDRYFWRVSPLHDGVAGVFIERDRWGIIDVTGEFILEPMEIAVVIGSTGHDRTNIHLPEGDVLLDRQVAERLAQDPTPLLGRGDGPITCRNDGITIGGKDGIVTYADIDGTPLIRGAFDYARCFGGGRAVVAMRDRQEWCEIDKRGDVLEGSCHCWQPIAIIEFDESPREGLECYPKGLSILRELGGRDREAWLSP